MTALERPTAVANYRPGVSSDMSHVYKSSSV
jgi:hypothetical protein